MKYLLIILYFLPFISQAQSVKWDDPIVVNDNNTIGNTRPKVAVTKDGNPLVMWGKATNQGVYVSKLNNGSFTSPLKVTPDGINAFVQSWAGPGLDARGDTAYVTFKSQPESSGFVYVVRSTDGGKTFGDTIRVSDNNWSRFPEVAILPNGNPVVTFMDFDKDFHDPRYVVAASSDGGKSFGNTVNASGKAPGEACDCCPGFIMADQKRITILFRNNDNDLRDIWASISTDGGKTFELAKDIDNNNWMIGACPSTGPEAITVGDSLISVWMSGATGRSVVNVGTANITDLNVGINAVVTPDVANAIQNYPKIAGDQSVLAVTWQEVAQSSRNVMFGMSITGASGLQKFTPIQVNVNSQGVQQNPDIAYDGDYVHLVWQDITAKKLMYRRGKISTVAGFESLSKASLNATIYPNPATNVLTINISDQSILNSKIQLNNVLGQTVLSTTLSNNTNNHIPVGHLTPGVYTLQLSNQNSTLIEKIEIQ
ncbi:MAG: hypothetical protein ACI8SE_001160 [Bacteroidia bacterium]|jgi:hypothetical protein